MIFNGKTSSNNSTFDEDYFASKKLDWIFNNTNLSSGVSDQSTGSYQIGFINKDKSADGKKTSYGYFYVFTFRKEKNAVGKSRFTF